MNNAETLQRYINDFRRHLAPLLRPSIGLSCIAFPAIGPGAVLEFTMKSGIANDDYLERPTATVNDALGKIKQTAFGGNLQGFLFGGTNVIMEADRIILIKGDDKQSSWTDGAADDDVKNLLQRTITRPVPTGVGAA